MAVQVRASARVIRPVRIEFSSFERAVRQPVDPKAPEMQRARDAQGTPWIEFS